MRASRSWWDQASLNARNRSAVICSPEPPEFEISLSVVIFPRIGQGPAARLEQSCGPGGADTCQVLARAGGRRLESGAPDQRSRPASRPRRAAPLGDQCCRPPYAQLTLVRRRCRPVDAGELPSEVPRRDPDQSAELGQADHLCGVRVEVLRRQCDHPRGERLRLPWWEVRVSTKDGRRDLPHRQLDAERVARRSRPIGECRAGVSRALRHGLPVRRSGAEVRSARRRARGPGAADA